MSRSNYEENYTENVFREQRAKTGWQMGVLVIDEFVRGEIVVGK